MVTETKNEIVFDGGGNPVIEKSGYQTYHAVTGTPPPAGWQPPIRSYQIWSTVLGGSLMTYHPANDYRETKVYAGGAVIAEKTRGVENNQTVEHNGWKTSDPVTGTQAVFNQYGAVKLEEIEPLGQAIAFHDSSAPPEPSPNEPIPRRNADDPHWQCEAGKGFWGGFTGYPFHCQKKMIQDLDYELKNLFGWGEQVENPSRIPGRQGQGEPPIPNYGMPNSAADNVMAFALRATTKKTGIEGGSSDGCKFDKNGNKTCGVNVPIPPLDMSVIPGFVGAEVDGDDPRVPTNEQLRNELVNIRDRNDGKCGEFLDKVKSELGIKEKFEDLFDALIKKYSDSKGKKGGIAYVESLASPAISIADEDYPSDGEYPYNGKDIYGKKRKSAVALKTRPVNNGSVQVGGYVNDLIHELLHYAGKNHKKFAEAAFAASDGEEAFPTKKAKGLTKDQTYSKFFQNLFTKYCR